MSRASAGPRRTGRARCSSWFPELDDLAWWSAALEKARAGGELQPGSFRLRAALAAAK
jgi:hypothetical protein